MAIDTENKRRSVSNWICRIPPVPDGTISAFDRRHVAGFYRGSAVKLLLGISSTPDLLLGISDTPDLHLGILDTPDLLLGILDTPDLLLDISSTPDLFLGVSS